MLGKKILLAAVLTIACVFTGCESEPEFEVITIPKDKEIWTINDVHIEVSPLKVKQGKSIAIDITHEKGDSVDVEISSESLVYKEIVTTPYHTKMKMDTVGVHDLSFTVSLGIMGIGMSTDITVTK